MDENEAWNRGYNAGWDDVWRVPESREGAAYASGYLRGREEGTEYKVGVGRPFDTARERIRPLDEATEVGGPDGGTDVRPQARLPGL